ncbi:MAG: nucleotidyltransferase domain-containing protein [Defluviitaleaceae bacterium]|nr:nucleotidyltransferase domain-containing protein [Defluviitaleaceae bacterium]
MKHHEDSIINMAAHYQADPDVIALFLIGSVATGTEREDSDIDAVAVVSDEVFERKRAAGATMEVVHGKCTYPGGYIDTHFSCPGQMRQLVESGSEPMRNMFMAARPLFCKEDGLIELAASIPRFPAAELEAKKLRYYCTMKQAYLYFWLMCKPQGYHRHHIANIMVFSLYRLILLENEVLFPSVRKLEECVINATNKPEGIVQQCHEALASLSDQAIAGLVETYERWTSYDYPKDRSVVINNFKDPYEWQ